MRTALKSNRFRLAKQLCTCITLFCTFPLTTMHDYKVKVPNFMFCEHTKTTSFFSFTSIQSCRIKLLEKFANRVFSLTWPAYMQIYWNKRKRLHKKRVQLPEDWFGTPTWPPFHCFGTPIWPP